MNQTTPRGGSFFALTPLLFFLVIYLATSLVSGDFYTMPISVAFLMTAVYAVTTTRRIPFAERVERFSRGAGDSNVLLMIWIFVLAGAFSETARQTGAVDATVNLTLNLLPESLLPAGLFIAACFISLSIGTSVGTVVALVPVASGLAEQVGAGEAWLTAVVVGGAFFGDNLSFISDTTIAATRTQGCRLYDKFRVNVRIVTPAALITLAIYLFSGGVISSDVVAEPVEWNKVIPYLVVLVLSLCRMNVMKVLMAGIVTAAVIGVANGAFTLRECCSHMGRGISGMGDLIIVTMLAGGVLEMIRLGGGIDWLVDRLTSRISSQRAAEASIAALVSLANLCTANNTIAILTTGGISREIAEKYGIDPRRTASILDTFSCFVQGLLPYGAQILMAAGLTALSPPEIIRHLYYPAIMGVVAMLAIVFRYPRMKN